MKTDYSDYSNLFFFKTAFVQQDFEKHLIKECFLSRSNGIPVLNFFTQEASELFTQDLFIMLLQAAFLHKRINEALWILDYISYDGKGIDKDGMEFTILESEEPNALAPIYLPDIFYKDKPQYNLLEKNIYKNNHPAWLFLLGLLDKWQILDISYHSKISSRAIEFSYNVFHHRKIISFFRKSETQELIFSHTKPETHQEIKNITIELNVFHK